MAHCPAIMIVEDDEELTKLLKQRLSEYGFRADSAGNGEELFRKLSCGQYDLILLDIMLPGEDGLGLCRKLRESSQPHASIPVIFTSALGESADRIVGLEMGADDYLPKPFVMRELIARIRAVLRRSGPQRNCASTASNLAVQSSLAENGSDATICFAGWKLNVLSRCLVDSNDIAVALSGTEFQILLFFLRHPNQVLSREQILANLENGADVYDRSVDVRINRLRGKLRDTGKNPAIIRTVRGAGYMLAANVRKEK